MFLLIFFLWIVFNARITIEVIIIGLLVTAAVYWFLCKYLKFSPKQEQRILKALPYAFCYLFVLIWEIIMANAFVSKRILFYKPKLEPELISFQSGLKTDLANVILANSITLTPGTITVSLKNGEYWVHCLDKSLAKGLDNSVFLRLLKKMER